MDYKYNVYYSTSPTGPWTLANLVPITHDDLGNSYTITGLEPDMVYYFTIVGGVIEDEELVPLITQSVGPINQGAGDHNVAQPVLIKSKTYSGS